MSWDIRWIGLAEHIAQWSKDKNTKVGAVIVDARNSVISLGWNGLPRGVDDSMVSRYARPQKYAYTEHAERNAIYNAASIGVSLNSGTLYSTLFPCADCARAIIQSGIKELVTPEPNWHSGQWGESFQISRQMLEEASVKVRYI